MNIIKKYFIKKREKELLKLIAETEEYMRRPYINVSRRIAPIREDKMKKDIEEVLYIFNNSIDEETARNIFIKSLYFVKLGVFAKKKRKVTEEIFYEYTNYVYPSVFSKEQSTLLFEYLACICFSITLGWGHPERNENGVYIFNSRRPCVNFKIDRVQMRKEMEEKEKENRKKRAETIYNQTLNKIEN